MKTGIELIAQERAEQFSKHGRTVEMDVTYNQADQLPHGAVELIAKGWGWMPVLDNGIAPCPYGWDEALWMKMYSKPYKERLIIAAALIAAEIDRIQAGEYPF